MAGRETIRAIIPISMRQTALPGDTGRVGVSSRNRRDAGAFPQQSSQKRKHAHHYTRSLSASTPENLTKSGDFSSKPTDCGSTSLDGPRTPSSPRPSVGCRRGRSPAPPRASPPGRRGASKPTLPRRAVGARGCPLPRGVSKPGSPRGPRSRPGLAPAFQSWTAGASPSNRRDFGGPCEVHRADRLRA